MNIVLELLKKDLLRDWKRPWGTLVLLAIPFLMASFMSLAFGGGKGIEEKITIHLAVLDNDKDFLSGMIRSLSSQDESTQRLVFHIVETEEEGIELLERRQASAFVMLPENMTADLLDGATTTIRFYGNPAEQILPIVVEQGVDLIVEGLSQTVRLLGPQIKKIREYIEDEEMPSTMASSLLFYSTAERIKSVRKYAFPPLLTFNTVAAKDYIPSASRVAPSNSPDRSAP